MFAVAGCGCTSRMTRTSRTDGSVGHLIVDETWIRPLFVVCSGYPCMGPDSLGAARKSGELGGL
jgi:hypothetical protein